MELAGKRNGELRGRAPFYDVEAINSKELKSTRDDAAQQQGEGRRLLRRWQTAGSWAKKAKYQGSLRVQKFDLTEHSRGDGRMKAADVVGWSSSVAAQ
ncbi:hypothetical protein Dda_3205 [Drechslerella dactyloides]|uniref:Uncharacterized protein n=1 Tax=Drechslerella dactyloides TaxID=74499 RepID=A0AAD6J254_DREDA|nr:hypothetical protein Dda_3205 [Drechslerella dactyloides]